MKSIIVMFLAVLIGAPLASGQAQTQPASARSVIQMVMRDVLAVLRDPKLSREEKYKRVRAIADERIDFASLSRLTMARHWRDLTPPQQADFVKAFTEHVSITHANIIDEYVDEQVEITGDRAEDRGDWTVQTRIVGKNEDGTAREVAKVDYRMRQTADQWKIIDVTIDGVSLVANFRAQFQEILANGSFDQLMKLLRDKIKEGEAAHGQ